MATPTTEAITATPAIIIAMVELDPVCFPSPRSNLPLITAILSFNALELEFNRAKMPSICLTVADSDLVMAAEFDSFAHPRLLSELVERLRPQPGPRVPPPCSGRLVHR